MIKKICVLLMVIFISACTREEDLLHLELDGNSIEIKGETIYTNEDAVKFPAVVRSSGKKPLETEYKGLELSKLLETLGVNVLNYSKITFNASDGYTIILNIDEIKEPSNVYIAFERDGLLLKSKKEGGTGPFQLVIRRDPFSQRWIKHVEEIILQ